ncbi:MAG: hypothetical protein ABIK37_02380 [candidate division WOR-3 bacterium]
MAHSERRMAHVAGVLAFALGLVCCARSKGPESRSGDRAGPLVYPRVLFLTTGADGSGTLPSGANICLETFSRLGAVVEIADKTVLLDSARLASARIVVAPTIAGYHDADRTFSLSFLDDASMKNLAAWVEAGGILIAGENIGRNTIEGEDRVTSGGILDSAEWPLARVFGYSLAETNLKGFSMVKDSAGLLLAGFRTELAPVLPEAWLLVPVDSTVAGSVRVLSYWVRDRTRHPAITLNRCGRGWGILVPLFLLLQPAFDGGAGDVPAIVEFYARVFALAFDGPAVHVNPWPGAHRSALAVTLNEAEVVDSAADARLGTTLARLLAVPGLGRLDVFVTGLLPDSVVARLKKEPRVKLASLSYSHRSFVELDFCRTMWEIVRVEDRLRRPLTGFRFPFSRRTPAGLFGLARRGYRYESSVYVNHVSGLAGALFPYNLAVWVKGQYCLVTDMLELSPTVEDWDFYGAGVASAVYDDSAQARDARRFAARLESDWQSLVRARRGMMILTLHSAYSGYSGITLAPVTEFLAAVAGSGDVWLAGMDDIADWWNARRRVDIRMTGSNQKTILRFVNNNPAPVRNLAVRLTEPGLNIQVRGATVSRVERTEEDGTFTYLVFDLDKTAELEVTR